jgi:hypothetical protein
VVQFLQLWQAEGDPGDTYKESKKEGQEQDFE